MSLPERRVHLANGLRRAALEAEVQAPNRSQLSPLLFHLARLAAADPKWATAHDWEAIAAAFYNIEMGLDTEEIAAQGIAKPIPEQRPRPPQPDPKRRRPA